MCEEIESVMIKVEVEDPDLRDQLKPEPASTVELISPLRTRRGRPKTSISDKNQADKPLRKYYRKNIHRKDQLEDQSNSDTDCNRDTTHIPKARKLKTANHICTICPMKFTRFMDLERHVYRHTGIRNYSCSDCSVKFITTNDLNKHMQSHAVEANYHCVICSDKKFRTVMSLRAHIKLCHGDKEGESKHLCTECGGTFRTGSTLWMHKRRIHTDIRKFKCGLCDKGFCKQVELSNHMKSHTDFREYKCDLCPAEYKRKITLLIHKTEKHGVGHHSKEKCAGSKNQACPYCMEKFALKEQLQFHVRRNHTGAKPYQCCLCQKSFIRKGYVKDHLKRKHHMTGEQIAMGDYVISNEIPISNALTEDGSVSLDDGRNMSMTSIPQAVYKDEDISDTDEDCDTNSAKNYIV